ncbi:hypothetical protein [Longimicrobium terrae]|uniref:Uncharacterized protein n=1 Tax=Longimicrobium terrae TaxID=1639882 RepID=A0A841GUX7_9BACT|nr:hypothetical protein [Longimicrobium terrae]MBB4634076.1 hypothetical protein [Longimicrobium terrae]MBB6069034.1 hypothetical protein [Longimicrobium terrae]NNC28210.1 hypothetical protein [Longimicrobium terrae]
MYVRFVVDKIDQYSGIELGIFQAAFRLWRAGRLAPHEEVWWAEIRRRLNLELEEPDRFARSRRPGARELAVSWFKASAAQQIALAREVCALLAQHEVATRMLTTDRPGYIVYEDDHQVAAEPFRPERR